LVLAVLKFLSTKTIDKGAPMVDKEESKRIEISFDQLDNPEVSRIVEQMERDKQITMVREVGANAPGAKSKNSGGLAILTLTAGGIVGGLLAFGLQRVLFSGPLANASTTVINLTFTFILAFVIGMSVSITDAASTRIASKVGIAAAIAFPTSIVAGLAIGQIANLFYSAMMEGIYRTAQERFANNESEEAVYDWIRNSTHLPRGLAWLLVGVAAGLTVGIASRSLKRTGLCVGGGAVGGFLGGFIFDFMPTGLDWAGQLLGITLTGLFVGLAMALLEQAARTQWIEIIAGGMAGKQFILYKTDITIGSSPQADITLIKDPTISPVHARVYAQGGRSYLESVDPTRPCSVGGRVETRIALGDLMDVTIGGTIIRFREKAGKTQQVGGIGRLS
jgi:hypothetical protein